MGVGNEHWNVREGDLTHITIWWDTTRTGVLNGTTSPTPVITVTYSPSESRFLHDSWTYEEEHEESKRLSSYRGPIGDQVFLTPLLPRFSLHHYSLNYLDWTLNVDKGREVSNLVSVELDRCFNTPPNKCRNDSVIDRLYRWNFSNF